MRRVAFGLTLAFLWVAIVTGVQAHGIGQSQVINVENGPYLLSVWSDPDPLRVDQTHIVVAVMDPETRAPLIEDVEVSVRMEIPGDPASAITNTAESDNSVNQLLYAIVFDSLPSTGTWQATVIVEGTRGSADDVTFPLEIAPPQRFDWVQIGLGSLVALTLLWLVAAMLQASAHTTGASAAARRKVMSGR